MKGKTTLTQFTHRDNLFSGWLSGKAFVTSWAKRRHFLLGLKDLWCAWSTYRNASRPVFRPRHRQPGFRTGGEGFTCLFICHCIAARLDNRFFSHGWSGSSRHGTDPGPGWRHGARRPRLSVTFQFAPDRGSKLHLVCSLLLGWCHPDNVPPHDNEPSAHHNPVNYWYAAAAEDTLFSVYFSHLPPRETFNVAHLLKKMEK